MNFTADWFTPNVPNWKLWLAPLAGRPGLRGVEIGSFEGRSACWLLEYVFTSPGSLLFCIDVQIRDAFRENLQEIGAGSRAVLHECSSSEFFRKLLPVDVDVIYIDGSHHAKNVLEDSVLAWHFLRPDGVLIWDDYRYGPADDPQATEWDRPGPAIDAFLSAYRNELERLEPALNDPSGGWQLAVRKVGP